MPWLTLARASGLGTRADRGLAFAVWPNGAILRFVPGDRTGLAFDLGVLDATQLEALSEVITDSGIEARKSASRYIDLPEDGLVMRAKGQTRCWYDTPGTEATPGLAQIAEAVLRMELRNPTRLNLRLDQWLPWSHHWEKACAS